MSTTLRTEIRNHDTDEPLLDMTALSLLYGVPEGDITALPIVNGAMRIPREWVQRGWRRCREAEAHTGSDFILDTMAYWAAKDHGARLEVAYL